MYKIIYEDGTESKRTFESWDLAFFVARKCSGHVVPCAKMTCVQG